MKKTELGIKETQKGLSFSEENAMHLKILVTFEFHPVRHFDHLTSFVLTFRHLT